MGSEVEEQVDAAPAHPPAPRPGRRSGRRIAARVALGLFALLALVAGGFWFARERIAGDVITAELERRDIPATYTIESIGPYRQVLRDIVIGDPARPDLVVARAVVETVPRLGTPAIGTIHVEGARLYGTWREGQRLSFGTLDPLLFTGSEEPFALPDLDLAIRDGRMRLDTPYGPVGALLEGRGNPADGFVGTLAATAPDLAVPGCSVGRASAYGQVTTAGGRPAFEGPLRLGTLRCADAGIALADAAVTVEGRAAADLSAASGDLRLSVGRMAVSGTRANGANGTVGLRWRGGPGGGAISARYDLAARGIAHPQAALALLELDGTAQRRGSTGRMETRGTLSAAGLRPGVDLAGAITGTAQRFGDTLLAPLLRQAGAALAREGRGSDLRAAYTVRRDGRATSVMVPQARLTGRSGATLLALSRFQLTRRGDAAPRFAGNFATSGPGLPRLSGRMEQTGPDSTLRLAMAEYAVGDSRLAIPELTLIQGRGSAFTFSGRIEAGGALPGGNARGLVVPVEGRWSDAGLVLGERCTPLAFDALTIANLTLDGQRLTLCPPPGGAILRSPAGGPVRVAAGAPALQLSGRLGNTPIRMATGAVGFAWPGAFTAQRVVVGLGPVATEARFVLADLTAAFGDGIEGRFDGTEAYLNAVPLDLTQASGTWRYAQGQLRLADGSFVLTDRADPARFAPLVARDAALTLEDNRIRAAAALRNPASDRIVTDARIVHDLDAARGFAELTVAGLTFDKALQPDGLSRLALGIVANVSGQVDGTGRIDWGPGGVTSTGRFCTAGLDLAAAFGPVKGATGTVAFTDLLGLTTAPGQRLAVASVNPGIEVFDGTVTYALDDGQVLRVGGGTWPFLGGTLYLRPVDLNLGLDETRRYTLEVTGLDAAKFVQRLSIDNVSATGVFDGTLPLVFNGTGGRIEGGVLMSRPPGGNLAYVGELTYADLTPIANFAFDALKSLDYSQMRVAMDGNLTGQLITRVRFDGVRQGAGTTRNFITRRLSRLPLQFNINIRAPFYDLITSVRALYDPAYTSSPGDVGLTDARGRPLPRTTAPTTTTAPATQDARRADQPPPVQTPESENDR